MATAIGLSRQVELPSRIATVHPACMSFGALAVQRRADRGRQSSTPVAEPTLALRVLYVRRMMTNTKKKLNLKLETVQVLSDATLAAVAGGVRNGGPDQRSDVESQAQVSGAFSNLVQPTARCIISCFCTGR